MRQIFATCLATAPSDSTSRCAICPLDSPSASAMSASTSVSRSQACHLPHQMSGGERRRRRRRDAALLRAAGAREGGVLAAQVLEGVLHAFTATLLGLLALAAASPLLAGAAGLSISDALIRAPWAELNVVANLTLVTTCLAVVASSRARSGQGVGQTLRARD